MPLPLTPPPGFRPRGTAASANPLSALTMPEQPGIRYQKLAEFGHGDIFGPEIKDEQRTDVVAAQQREQEQKRQDHQQREQRQLQIKSANSAALAKYQQDNRPTYTDPLSGLIVPQHDDATWEAEKKKREEAVAAKATKAVASQEATLDSATRTGLGRALTSKKQEELKNTVASQRDALDAAARDHARKQIEDTQVYKDANTGWFDLKLDQQPTDEEGKNLLEKHKLLSDQNTPLDDATLEEVRQKYAEADPAAHEEYLKQKAALDGDTAKRQKLSVLGTKEQRARAIAAGNDPAAVMRALPKTADEYRAALDEDHAKLSEIRAQNAKGLPGDKVQAASDEERTIIQRIQQNTQGLQKSRAGEAQVAAVGKATTDADLHQAAADAIAPDKPAPALTEKNGALVEEGAPGAKPLAIKQPDGSLVTTPDKASTLDRVVAAAGQSPVFLASGEIKAAEEADTEGNANPAYAAAVGMGAAKPMATADDARKTLEAKRAAASKHYDALLPDLQNFTTRVARETAPQRDTIQARLNRGELSQQEAEDAMSRHIEDTLQGHDEDNQKASMALQAALRDFGDGVISAQQLNKLYAAAGRTSGVEVYQQHVAEQAKEKEAEAVAKKEMLGSTASFHMGEGGDPSSSGEYRANVQKAKSQSGHAGYVPYMVKVEYADGSDDGIYSLPSEDRAKKMLAEIQTSGTDDGKKIKSVALDTEKERLQSAQQGIATQQADFDKKLITKLAPFKLDPSTQAGVIQRARFDAVREMPRSTKELLSSGRMAENLPFVGGIIMASGLLPVANTVGKLQNGEKPSEQELAALNETLIELERPNTWTAGALNTTAQSLGYMVELASTSGLYTAGKEIAEATARKGIEMLLTKEGRALAAKAMAKYGAKYGADVYGEREAAKFAANVITRGALKNNVLGRTARGIVGAALQTPVASLDNIVEKAVSDYATKGVNVEQDAKGVLSASIDATKHPESIAAALPQAYLYNLVENTSEGLGNMLERAGVGKALGAAISQPVKEKLMGTALAQAIARANPGKSVGAIGKFMRAAHKTGLVSEELEEVAGNVGHAIFNGEEFSLPSRDEVTQLAASMIIPGLAGHVSHARANSNVQQSRDAAALAHSAVRADLADPAKAAQRMTEELQQPVSTEDIAAAQNLVGPIAQGDGLRAVENAQADYDQRAAALEQSGDVDEAFRLRKLAAAHERAKTPAAVDDLAEAVLATKNITEVRTNAEQQVKVAEAQAQTGDPAADMAYQQAQQNLAAATRASALVKIARGRGDLLTTEEQAALATAPMPAVVNDGAGDIITDSGIAELKATAPAAARLIKQDETQRRAQLSHAQAQAASATSAPVVSQPAPLPAGVSGNAPATGGASPVGPAQGAVNPASPAGAAPASNLQPISPATKSVDGNAVFQPNADGTLSAEFASDDEAKAWVQTHRSNITMGRVVTTGGKTVLTVRPKEGASPSQEPTQPVVASPPKSKGKPAPGPVSSAAASPTTGTWSAKGKSGTLVSVPASAAKSPQEALEQLGAQLPLGEPVDPGSLIPPKRAVPAPAASAPEVAEPAQQPARAVKFMDFNDYGRLDKEVELPHAEALRQLRGRESVLKSILNCLGAKGAAA